MRPRRLRRLLALGAFGALLAGTGVGWGVGVARADEPGCETVLWGFLGSQRRTLCDGPMFGDGSWNRLRIVWVPAHQVPLTTNCYGGRYSVSCSTSGGYFVPYTEYDHEIYPVTSGTVLPDEPGYLGNSVAVVS